MACFLTSRCLTTLYFLTLCFKSLTANSSFSFTNFTQNSGFDSVLTLHGDAKVSNDGWSVQLTTPLNHSTGRLIYKRSVRFYGGIPKKLVSFSTYFSFSISSDSRNGGGLAFVVFSDDKSKFLSVGFDASMDDNLSNFVSVKVTNLSVSSVSLGVDSGNRLQVWIDYESMSRRLEVRLNQFGENRPLDPLLFEQIDLPKIWPEKEGFFVGLSSSNSNSSQECNVYSWSFGTRRAPDWMHSEPLDPIASKQGEENEVKILHKKSDCVMRILSALILGIGLGGLGSFIGMIVWTLFAKRQPISPEEFGNGNGNGTKSVVHDKGSSANEKQ